MKSSIIKIGVISFSLTVGLPSAYAGDIVDGWSDKESIISIRHHSEVVDYLLTGSMSGCGTPSDASSYWRQAIEDNAINKDRRALLYLAYATGKKVQLRCENSHVTDLAIADK